MIGLASLGSGSRGNGTVVAIGNQLLLVDCGFTLKQTETRLRRIDLRPADISAVLVSHEHSDHLAGVAPFAHKYAIPVYASAGTIKASKGKLVATAISSAMSFCIGNVTVKPVTVPHDAREPTQFVFEADGVRIGVISDLGHVTPFVVEHYQDLHGLMMESNHDRDMLMQGRYPDSLKRRVGGTMGHLGNEQAGQLLAAVANENLNVVIGHISMDNNHQDRLESVFAPLRERVASLSYANQSEGHEWTLVGNQAADSAAANSFPTRMANAP